MMPRRPDEISPQAYARIGGALYLVIIALGVFGQMFVRERLVVPGDAAATAANISASETLWRLSVTGELMYLACGLVLGFILYVLLKPVSRNVAMLGLLFNVVAIAVEVPARLHLLTALALLGDAPYLQVLEPEQRHALAYLWVRLHDYGFSVSLLFFAGVCLAFGDLIRRSGYLPWLIGVLMQIAGLCYIVNTFAFLLAPSLSAKLYPAILMPVFVAEASLCVWLLVKGVNVAKWRERSAA
jgi:hypothetical protein